MIDINLQLKRLFTFVGAITVNQNKLTKTFPSSQFSHSRVTAMLPFIFTWVYYWKSHQQMTESTSGLSLNRSYQRRKN